MKHTLLDHYPYKSHWKYKIYKIIKYEHIHGQTHQQKKPQPDPRLS